MGLGLVKAHGRHVETGYSRVRLLHSVGSSGTVHTVVSSASDSTFRLSPGGRESWELERHGFGAVYTGDIK